MLAKWPGLAAAAVAFRVANLALALVVVRLAVDAEAVRDHASLDEAAGALRAQLLESGDVRVPCRHNNGETADATADPTTGVDVQSTLIPTRVYDSQIAGAVDIVNCNRVAFRASENSAAI